MRRVVWAMLATMFVAGLAVPACAGWHSFYERVKLDWHRNNAWPHPFVNQDRMAVCAPFATMTENGWNVQSTLTSDHFNPKTHELTAAGESKVRDIVTQHPEQSRTVYVVVGRTNDETERRTDSVQRALTDLIVTGPLPAVMPVSIEPRGRPAQEIQFITDAYQQSMPQPRLGSAASPGATN